MSPTQRLCIIHATIAPLAWYRRGYAISKAGPFFRPSTVRPLLNSGALRQTWHNSGRNVLTALAKVTHAD